MKRKREREKHVQPSFEMSRARVCMGVGLNAAIASRACGVAAAATGDGQKGFAFFAGLSGLQM